MIKEQEGAAAAAVAAGVAAAAVAVGGGDNAFEILSSDKMAKMKGFFERKLT